MSDTIESRQYHQQNHPHGSYISHHYIQDAYKRAKDVYLTECVMYDNDYNKIIDSIHARISTLYHLRKLSSVKWRTLSLADKRSYVRETRGLELKLENDIKKDKTLMLPRKPKSITQNINNINTTTINKLPVIKLPITKFIINKSITTKSTAHNSTVSKSPIKLSTIKSGIFEH